MLIFILLSHFPCLAQDHLFFSRPQSRSGMGVLMGERILKEVYSRLGIDFEYRELPIKRCLLKAIDGDTDGVSLRGAGLDQVYPNLKMISVPIGYADIVVYSKYVEFAVDSWQSLTPYSIGIVREFRRIREKTKGMQVEAVPTLKQAFLKLNAGRTDVVVETRSSQCVLKNLNVSGIRILEPPLEEFSMFHYIHKRHTDIAVKVEKILKQMEQNGELKALQNQAIKDYMELCGQ